MRLLALVLYALGFVSNGLHFSLFRHEVCEHGELVHVAVAATQACEHGVVGQHAHDGESEGGEGLHEHCALSPATNSTPLAVPRAAEALARGERLLAARRREAPRAASIELVLIAPHHSPPSA